MTALKIKFSKSMQALLLALLIVPCFSSCKEKEKPELPKSSDKLMSNLVITADGQPFKASLQSDDKTFHFIVPYGFDQNKLKTAVATFTLSPGAKSDPLSGSSQDFTQDVTYVVSAEDETVTTYIVKKIDGLSSEATFLSFKLFLGGEDLEGEIIDAQSKIIFDIPVALWDDLEDISPTFAVSSGAVANPAMNVKRDFRENVTYEITAANGTTKRTWTVICNSNSLGEGFNNVEIGAAKTFVELGYPGTFKGWDVDPDMDSKLYGDLWMYLAYCGNNIVLLSRVYADADPSSTYCIKVVDKTTLNDAGSLNLGSISIANLKMITSDYMGRCVAAVVSGDETEFFYWTTTTAVPVSVGKIGVNMATNHNNSSSHANFQVAGDITGNAWITALAPLKSTGEHYRVKVTNGQLASNHSIVTTGYSSADCNWYQMISPLDDSDEPMFVVGDSEGTANENNSIKCYINDFALTYHVMPSYWQDILQEWWVGTGRATSRGRSPFVSALPINGKSYVLVTSGSSWWHSAAVLNSDLQSLAHKNLNIAFDINRNWSFGAWADWYYNEELKEAYLAIWFGRLGMYTYKMTCE